jgi:hypothetical protein
VRFLDRASRSPPPPSIVDGIDKLAFTRVDIHPSRLAHSRGRLSDYRPRRRAPWKHSIRKRTKRALAFAAIAARRCGEYGVSPDRPVRRSKTASHNGKICVNDGVIKRSLLRANVRGGRQCGDGAITRGNTNLTVYP